MPAETVAVIGASDNPERYSHQACRSLLAHGHRVFAVSPHGRDILQAEGRKDVGDIDVPLDTVTLYVSPPRQAAVIDALVQRKPGRVIFNPGTESELSERRLEEAGVPTLRACTFVLLDTGQY